MIRLLAAVVLALGLLVAADRATAQVTYDFQGSTYDAVLNGGTCVVGECTTLTTAYRITASITFAGPLAPNLVNADVSAQITAYSFSDGITATTGPGPNATVFQAVVTTDGSGALTDYDFLLQRTPGPPYNNSSMGAGVNSRLSLVSFTPLVSVAVSNAVCITRGPGPGAVSGPGSCTIPFHDTGTSSAASSNPTMFTVTPTVPTLREWAMILFVLMLAVFAVVTVHRRRWAA